MVLGPVGYFSCVDFFSGWRLCLTAAVLNAKTKEARFFISGSKKELKNCYYMR
jgi:hypothetical protein